MKAIVVRKPGDYGPERVKLPKPEDEGLLLKVDACALCGSDLRTLAHGHRKVTLPWIIGHEIAGTVVQVGRSYQGRWTLGDHLSVAPIVFCGTCEFCIAGKFDLCTGYREIAQSWPGGFAEYVAIPPEAVARGAIKEFPADFDPALAAVCEPMSSCLNAQEKGNVGFGDVVAIMGAGPVGYIHASIARLRGADTVIMVNRSGGRLRFARDFGVDETVNASETDPVERVKQIARGGGADVVISANSNPTAIPQAIQMTRKGGRVLVFGGLPKDNCTLPVDMNYIHYNAISVIGTTALAPRHQAESVRLVTSGKLPADKLVTHRLPLADFAQGVELARSGEALKVVYTP